MPRKAKPIDQEKFRLLIEQAVALAKSSLKKCTSITPKERRVYGQVINECRARAQNITFNLFGISSARGLKPSLRSRVYEEIIRVFYRLFPSEVCERFINAHIRYIYVQAGKKNKRTKEGMDFHDLVSDGKVGLMNGLWRYNYKRGYKTLTYLAHWIMHEMRRSIHNKGFSSYGRVPVHVHDLRQKIAKYRGSFRSKYGEEPTNAEIAKALKTKEENIEKALTAQRLDKTINVDEATSAYNASHDTRQTDIYSVLPVSGAMAPDDSAMIREMHGRLVGLATYLLEQAGKLKRADMREACKAIITERLLKPKDERHTLNRIGDELDYSRERIRQLQGRLTKLAEPYITANMGDELELFRNRDQRSRELPQFTLMEEFLFAVTDMISGVEEALQ